MKKIDIIILCGGGGSRLKKRTLITPKPLTKFGSKPFVYYLIKYFNDQKFVNKIFLATGYKSDKFTKFTKDKKFKNKVKLVDSGLVDIIKRIKDCKKESNNDFMVCYGDTFAALNLKQYLNSFHKAKNFDQILTSNYKIEFGLIKINKKTKTVFNFDNKSMLNLTINLGYILLRHKTFEVLKKFKSWINFLEFIGKNGSLKNYDYKGMYVSFNNEAELIIARKKLNKIKKTINI